MSRWKVVGVVMLVGLLSLVGGALGAGLAQKPQAQEGVAPQPVGSGFLYQGALSDENGLVDEHCDFTFALYDAASGGARVGEVQSLSDVMVENGRFSVLLNGAGQFGPDAFDGEARWLQIAVRCGDKTDFAALGRQPLTATPYAHFSLAAASVPWSGLTGVPAGLNDGDDDTTYTAGDGLLLIGTEFSVEKVPYANVIVVAKNGGDFASVQAALDNISDAAEGNRYLVWVAPGVYEEQVTMKPYVDIEGAGQRLTIVRYTGSLTSPLSGSGDSATIVGAGHSELRSLTVESENVAMDELFYSVALYANDIAGSLSLNQVTLSSSNGYENYGAYFENVSVRMVGSTVSASGHWGVGIENIDSVLELNNVIVTASGQPLGYAIANHNSSLMARHSRIYGSYNSIYNNEENDAASSTAKVANSELDGPIHGVGFTCIYSYDTAYSALDGNCQ